jgi:hypothetical protein
MDFQALITILAILVILFFPAVNRILMQLREQRGAMQGPPRPKPGPAQPVRSEIEEFLRRASRGTAGAGEAAAGQSPPRRPPAAPIQAEVVGDKPARGRVGEHVKSYLDASEFQRRSANLAEDMAEAAEKRTEHRQEVFGHSIGRLGAEAAPSVAPQDLASAEAPTDVPPPAFDLSALFTQPADLRRAIVLQEILQRPEHRWR